MFTVRAATLYLMAKSLLVGGWNSAGTVTIDDELPVNLTALVPVFGRGVAVCTSEPKSPISSRLVITGSAGVLLGSASHITYECDRP